MKKFIRVMKALSDPGRVKAVKMLEAGELCVCQIRAGLGLAQPTVSKHLKILEDAGLIQGRKVGPWVHYRLAGDPDSEYGRTMLEALKGWLDTDNGVREALAGMPKPGTPDRAACPAQA
ncbi:MAG: metalloregulator ArsR/SmtB family transcription factor [Desulfovibrionaceae bacterium]|nr:metalloregulator ArsR/SmtB family transcription factor [Desulfovibrionaceae bacterium]